MIVSMLIVVVGASFDEMYIEDRAEATPIITLLKVTISPGDMVVIEVMVIPYE
jgi:hypothetical protein